MKLFAATLVLLVAGAYCQIDPNCRTSILGMAALTGVGTFCDGVAGVDVNTIALTADAVCAISDLTCRTALTGVLVACGADATVCGGVVPPVTVPADITFPTGGTFDPSSICFGNALGPLIVAGTCPASISDDLIAFEQNPGPICNLAMGACRTALNAAFTTCLSFSLSDACTFGMIDFPTPAAGDADCVNRAATTNEARVTSTCGDFMSIPDFQRTCGSSGAACRSLLAEIYGPCNYDPVTPICSVLNPTSAPATTAGSVKIYAVPVVVLLSALMSVIF